ncbi:ribonuclease H1 small subunit [Lentithecium fluviatile CBS 122367]|uniref:Ribonuclease H1 small subunit n=1 Tax=Lentithecium fluviatile CBS 122367 TaxID=1168545 RepID=A0A6G1JJY4_9PLEO|nr:ribonuclease H1 small subunit [Lentithecium fluviatile CBS 122367]
MLAVQSPNPQKCTPNLLPARLNHNGPVNDASRYWQPTKDENGNSHAYFRGRHLHGTTLPLPTNYTGAILHMTDKALPHTHSQTHTHVDDEEEEGDDVMVDVKVAEKVGEFEELVVWGHGGEVDRTQDVFVRGVEEWVGFAEAMHGDGEGVGCEKKG